MKRLEQCQSRKSCSASRDFVRLSRFAAEAANESDDIIRSKSRSKQRDVQFRKQQIAYGWSKQERVDRLRAGVAFQAWLLDLFKTN